MTSLDGTKHFAIISIRKGGPDANRLTVLSNPAPSIASSDAFISKNLTSTLKKVKYGRKNQEKQIYEQILILK
jgi:hypothetical protein